jgi:hypothetical protein
MYSMAEARLSTFIHYSEVPAFYGVVCFLLRVYLDYEYNVIKARGWYNIEYQGAHARFDLSQCGLWRTSATVIQHAYSKHGGMWMR